VKYKLLLFLLFVCFFYSRGAIAKSWISVGVPSIYRFAAAENSPVSSGSSLTGTPAGYIIHGSIYEKPFIGYEKYQISVDSDNSDEPAATIDVEFYDIGLNFEQRTTYFLIGYGYGSIKMDCELSSCSGYKFREGIARHYFAQLGVMIFNQLGFHLSAHRIMGQNDITVGSTSDSIVLDGTLYAFGLRLNW
jgi:hypothetical protein